MCMYLNDSCLSKRKVLVLDVEGVLDFMWEILSCSLVQVGELTHLRHFVLLCPKLQKLRQKGLLQKSHFQITQSFVDQDWGFVVATAVRS